MFPTPSGRAAESTGESVSRSRLSELNAVPGSKIVRFISIRHKPTAIPFPFKPRSVGFVGEIVLNAQLSLAVVLATVGSLSPEKIPLVDAVAIV